MNPAQPPVRYSRLFCQIASTISMLEPRPHSMNYMPPFPPCSAGLSLPIKPGRCYLPSSHVCATTIPSCMCNYNTKICRMAMAQAVVPVYTIPNTYQVQQSLWEGICRIIPSIARTSGSELRSFEPAALTTPL